MARTDRSSRDQYSGGGFTFSQWDNWAKTKSANPDVKVYIGAPASSKAAGEGYVSASTLASHVAEVQQKYSSFGGVMLWDADTAYSESPARDSTHRDVRSD